MAYSFFGMALLGLGVAAGSLLLDPTGSAPVAQAAPDAHVRLAQNAAGDTAPVTDAPDGEAVVPAPLSSSQLPGGANSLQEGYQDWQVVCAAVDEGRQCAMIQQQSDERSGQRVLAVELTREEGATQGTLVLPFGLDLAHGAQLRIDEQEPMDTLPFSTCLPAGCLVPLPLNDTTLEALRTGKTLSINLRSQDSQDLAFSVSLNGFPQALDRIVELN